MNIPDKAVEAVARNLALLDDGEEWPTNEALGGSLTGTRDDEFRSGVEDQARELLELAAPFIAAQALRDAGKDLDARACEKHAEPVVHGIMRAESTRLHNRAAELDPS